MKTKSVHWNIDHYLSLLSDPALASEKRAAITKLLVQEEDKLGRDLEQLEFVDATVSRGRRRLNRLRQILDGTTESTRRAATQQLISILEDTQLLLEDLHRTLVISLTRANSQYP